VLAILRCLLVEQVGVLQRCLPNLLELHVAGNSITSLRVQLDEQQQQHAAEGQQREAAQQQQEFSCSGDSLAGFKHLQVSRSMAYR
jgi:hypothetical protein